MVFEIYGIFKDIYPTPKQRVENPVNTYYRPGDIVKILVGPATGRIGKVVVERNGNYTDYEPYSSEESIGVAVPEREILASAIEQMIKERIIDAESRIKTIIRWFDGPEQLEIVKEAHEKRKA